MAETNETREEPGVGTGSCQGIVMPLCCGLSSLRAFPTLRNLSDEPDDSDEDADLADDEPYDDLWDEEDDDSWDENQEL